MATETAREILQELQDLRQEEKGLRQEADEAIEQVRINVGLENHDIAREWGETLVVILTELEENKLKQYPLIIEQHERNN